MSFLRKFFFFLTVMLSSTLFFVLIGSKIISRLMALSGKQGPMSARWRWMPRFAGRGQQVPQLLDWMHLRAGEQVLELGAGTGLFTIMAARRVGRAGRLYAVDIQEEMISEVQSKIKAAGLSNVQTHVASAYELPLDVLSIDKAMLIDVLPGIPDTRQVLKEIERILKPNGTLYISEEFSEPDYWFIRETIARVESSGRFVLCTQQGNWWRYTLGFRKCQPQANEVRMKNCYLTGLSSPLTNKRSHHPCLPFFDFRHIT